MSKISSADCKNAINALLGTESKKWKRSAKYKAYCDVRSDLVIIREFTNIEQPNKLAFVFEHNDRIVETKVLEPRDISTDYPVDDINDTWREEFEENPLTSNPLIDLSWIDRRNDSYYENFMDSLMTRPYIMLDGDVDPQDFENYEFNDITRNEVQVDHGGDWQPCASVTYRYMSDRKFYFKGHGYKMPSMDDAY